MKLLYTFVLFITLAIPFNYSFAGITPPDAGEVMVTFNETDTSALAFTSTLVYFFDLRERETYVQLTYPDIASGDDDDDGPTGLNATAHVQIFNVDNNCNENDFFDIYTPSDTHVYNMRDIQSNDGNPSGVVLPDGAYGIVVISIARITLESSFVADPIGNMRILDNNGYEYRTNAVTSINAFALPPDVFSPELFDGAYSFNFNQEAGITFSDVVGITLFVNEVDNPIGLEYLASPVQGIYSPFDIDIYDLNEVPFSCRDIIYSCVDEDNPLLEEVLSVAGNASVASFEYGINNAIPHSKGGELLCPGNVISDGTVYLIPEPYSQTAADLMDQIGSGPIFSGFIGLNNGNGRGSLDSFFIFNFEFLDFG